MNKGEFQWQQSARMFFGNAKDCILIVDIKGNILFANSVLCKLTGYSIEELTALSVSDIESEESHGGISRQIEKIIAVGSGCFTTLFCGKSGRRFAVEAAGNLFETEGGQFLNIVFRELDRSKTTGNCEDIKKVYDELASVNMRLEEKVKERTLNLEKTMKALEAANRAKSDFISGMSHELRTPLNAIIGFGQVLEEEYFGSLNEKQKEYVNDILTSGQRLFTLINDILDLAGADTGKMEMALGPVKLKELLEGSYMMVKEKCLKHGIAFSLEVSPELLSMQITVDEKKLKQIVFNLLSNAVKFSPDGGSINLTVKKSKDSLVFSVKDTGVGVLAEERDKIFEPLYQSRSGLQDKTPGAGLGLTLAKKLVEIHSGKIYVESEGEGKGSTFTFTIPFLKAEEGY